MSRLPTRRKFASVAAGAALMSLCRVSPGQELDPERTAAEMIHQPAQNAIRRGLAFLSSRQHDDGSFGVGQYRGNVAFCSLAGMSFLAGGSTPGRGPYGHRIDQCLDYVLENVQESGFIMNAGSSSHGPMYGHGFATLFLAETYGMSRRRDTRERLGRAVQLIVNTQTNDGGWRYQPQRRDADVSVTICQVMALRAARNAGIFVPSETIDNCIDYIKRSQNQDGGFMYMINGGPSAFPRSAAGVVALYSAGVYEGEELARGLDYVMQHLPHGGQLQGESHYFYGHYYAVQAMWHAGGDYWQTWYPAIRDALVTRQRENGSWMDAFGPDYGTAMATIILQLPNNCIPIFQR